ncbi:hypothetical protein MKZ38_008974 [Zalerion maritima]|uniref:Uncharacterized protein n=1 Tax=Zalerion maritima TaxID=339359 RepID=A0AAD5WVY6_9PEZI|nr:hypothetical protein MKZ38_008974 [Zalerion maritima]
MLETASENQNSRIHPSTGRHVTKQILAIPAQRSTGSLPRLTNGHQKPLVDLNDTLVAANLAATIGHGRGRLAPGLLRPTTATSCWPAVQLAWHLRRWSPTQREAGGKVPPCSYGRTPSSLCNFLPP